ncbi:hypothetical protein O3P69_015206 [Scylla paramamosain]|uniref:Uncharacterized protein n=1 Tax=Scylla paramamosain TaxID=85552 RepID=A0AAW0T547_SCYPA
MSVAGHECSSGWGVAIEVYLESSLGRVVWWAAGGTGVVLVVSERRLSGLHQAPLRPFLDSLDYSTHQQDDREWAGGLRLGSGCILCRGRRVAPSVLKSSRWLSSMFKPTSELTEPPAPPRLRGQYL